MRFSILAFVVVSLVVAGCNQSPPPSTRDTSSPMKPTQDPVEEDAQNAPNLAMQRIANALHESPGLEIENQVLEMRDGVIILAGVVRHRRDSSLAESLAREALHGDFELQNQLLVVERL